MTMGDWWAMMGRWGTKRASINRQQKAAETEDNSMQRILQHLTANKKHLRRCAPKSRQAAIIRRRLISLACLAINAFHLWLKTSFEEKNIITPEALKYAPQGISDILLLVKDNTSAI